MAKLLGMDVHVYNNKIDWAKAQDAGAHFALIRAGGVAWDGSYFTDNWFERNAEVAPEFVYVGYWWVFRANYSAQDQIDYFINLIKPYRQDIPASLDNELRAPVSQAVFSIQLLLALGHLDQAWPARRHIEYTRSTFHNRFLAARPEFKELYDLWTARYTNQPEPWGNPTDLSYVYPRDYDEWVLWQWSADGNGRGQEFGAPAPPTADHDMDLDYFNGDLAAFKAYFGIGQDAIPQVIEVTYTKNAIMRGAIKGTNEHVLPVGTRLAVVDSQVAEDGSVWYNVGGFWILGDHVRIVQ